MDLKEFNKLHLNSNEGKGGTNHFTTQNAKIDILDTRLSEFGYKFVGMDGKEKDLDLYNKRQSGYDSTTGTLNRKTFLKYNKDASGHRKGDIFNKADPSFRGTILP